MQTKELEPWKIWYKNALSIKVAVFVANMQTMMKRACLVLVQRSV
jgi:hypothetical protein